MNVKPEGLAWQVLTDEALYLARKEVQLSVQELLGCCAVKLQEEAGKHDWLPPEAASSKAKITKGDNYLGKPWMVLDFPRVFEKDSVFAFRTMVLFGDAIHCTFHLSGRFLKHYIKSAHPGAAQHLMVCNEGNPWVHHVNSDAFQTLGQEPLQVEHGFIKLGQVIPFSEWNTIPEKVAGIFHEISLVLQR